MYMLHRARGLGLTARVFEAGERRRRHVVLEPLSRARAATSRAWSTRTSSPTSSSRSGSGPSATRRQPEILEYANHVADRFDLRRDIQFDTRVRDRDLRRRGRPVDGSHRPTAASCQRAVPDHGDRLPVVGAASPTSRAATRFEGATYHTGRWPHEGVDFTGKRVGVIGTGSSAIQSIPIIAEQASELVVFQRTASYSVPAHNAPLDEEEKRAIKADYAGFRARNSLMPTAIGSRLPVAESLGARGRRPRSASASTRSAGSTAACRSSARSSTCSSTANANETAAEFVRAKIREIVKDPEVAERLSPKTVIGCKRLCVDTGYFETFNRDNVELVDVSETPIEEITPHGLRVGDREFEFDCIVFATGFDAMTGALLSIDIRGRDGRSLRDAWAGGPRTYLGLGVGRVPEPLHDLRPGQPVGAHQHDRVDRAARELDHRLHRVPARQRATRASRRRPRRRTRGSTYVNAVADFTLFPSCNSWYLGANVPGKPRVFMPLLGFPTYVEKCDEVAAKGYEGFALSAR